MEPLCKKCCEPFHPRRKELGYTTCLKCSEEEKWSIVPVIHHKTGNEFQVVKDPEVAAEFMAKSQRSGFGTLKGMTGSWRRHVKNAVPEPEKTWLPPRAEPVLVVVKQVVAPADPSLYRDEEVAEKFFSMVDNGNAREAVEYLEGEFQSRKLSPSARKQLLYTVQQ